MSDVDAGDLVPPEPGRAPGRRRWQAAVGLAGLAGLAVAAYTTAGDLDDQALPSAGALAAALVLQVVALLLAARAWIALFPPDADRRALAGGLYTSQLAKYLPAGGLLQVAGQVTIAGQQTGMARAALRLPVFSLCLVAAGTTLGSVLVVAGDLPAWARALAATGVLVPAVLHRRLLAAVLRLAARVVRRTPPADALPPQAAILRAYAYGLGNSAAAGAAFAVLVVDGANVNPVLAVAAFCAAWVAGYLVVPVPSGIGVREAVLVAALPGMSTAALLAASVAHRLLGIVAEAGLAGTSRLRARSERARSERAAAR
ncbi:MAG TPA: hypothetical protein VFZ77_23765 [Acidimicrobiales bacterium]